jgi:hypothetical protein
MACFPGVLHWVFFSSLSEGIDGVSALRSILEIILLYLHIALFAQEAE